MVLKSCSTIETIILARLEEIIQEKVASKDKLISENAKFKEILKNLNDKEETRIRNEYKNEIVKLNALKKAVDSN